jgi:hypothetical protein
MLKARFSFERSAIMASRFHAERQFVWKRFLAQASALSGS